jgi:hypothetical protein
MAVKGAVQFPVAKTTYYNKMASKKKRKYIST